MFDISFSELMVIAVVALIVIGPEKLPKVARTAGAFFGRMQRFVAQVKDEVNREARFAELQHLQAEVQSSLQQEVQDIEQRILAPANSTPVTVEAEVVPAKKPRQPRKVKVAEGAEVTRKVSRSRAVDQVAKPRKSRSKAPKLADPSEQTPPDQI